MPPTPACAPYPQAAGHQLQHPGRHPAHPGGCLSPHGWAAEEQGHGAECRRHSQLHHLGAALPCRVYSARACSPACPHGFCDAEAVDAAMVKCVCVPPAEVEAGGRHMGAGTGVKCFPQGLHSEWPAVRALQVGMRAPAYQLRLGQMTTPCQRPAVLSYTALLHTAIDCPTHPILPSPPLLQPAAV